MKDTGFSVPAAKLDRLATSYQTDARGGGLAVFDEARGGLYSRPPVFPHELVSTIDDYSAIGHMMLDYGRHGRARILPRPAVEAMTTDQPTPEQRAAAPPVLGPNRGWGLGLAATQRVWDSPTPPAVSLDFWTSAYQAIED